MKGFRWEGKRLYLHGVFALGLLPILLFVHEIFGTHGWLALRRQQKEVQALEQQIRQLQQENQQLEMQIKALKSDPKTIEKQAREQLRLARPGEMIYVLPERPPEAGVPSAAPRAEGPPP